MPQYEIKDTRTDLKNEAILRQRQYAREVKHCKECNSYVCTCQAVIGDF